MDMADRQEKSRPKRRCCSSLRKAVRFAAFGLLTVACTASSFGPHGFTHPDEQYRITANGPRILGDDWILDSHYGDPDSPTQKTGPDYRLPIDFDTDDDGTTDYRTDTSLYDTRWIHRVHSNVIWTRTIPLPEKFAQREPRVLLADYIERISGTGMEFVTYQGTVSIVSTRYGTKTIGLIPAKLDGRPAALADIQVSNLDQNELDPSTPTRRVRLVLAHEPKPYVGPYGLEYPAVILAGYASQPEDFDQHLLTFEAFLKRIKLQ